MPRGEVEHARRGRRSQERDALAGPRVAQPLLVGSRANHRPRHVHAAFDECSIDERQVEHAFLSVLESAGEQESQRPWYGCPPFRRLDHAVRQEVDVISPMRNFRLELSLHGPAVHHERVDHVFMTRGEVVVVVAVAMQDLDDRPAAVERRGERELQQVVREEHALPGRHRRPESSKDRVEVFDRRPELEARLVIGVERAAKSRVGLQRVVRQDCRVGEPVGTPEPEESFDDVQHASELVGDDADDAR